MSTKQVQAKQSAKPIPAKRQTGQMSKHEIKKIVDTAIKENMPALESMVRSVLDERLQAVAVYGTGPNASGPAQQARIRKFVEDVYGDMDHVKKVYCSDDSYGEVKVVIIHDDEDVVRAFEEACDRSMKLEDLLPYVGIGPHILHESEVVPRHTSGTEIVFER